MGAPQLGVSPSMLLWGAHPRRPHPFRVGWSVRVSGARSGAFELPIGFSSSYPTLSYPIQAVPLFENYWCPVL